jgi:diguanylate cyclase (GGDEF)-like protein
MKILLIDDDPLVGEAITMVLKAHHHVVDCVEDGQAGLDLVEMWSYDLILLDVELPQLDGMEVCRKLRSQGCTVPILMLTAHDTSAEIVCGLDAGADDYIVKPWDENQLLARIRALTRRGGGVTPSPVLTWGDLRLDPRSAKVFYSDKTLSLAPKEYALLELFLRNPQRVFSRDAIIDRLWTMDTSPSDKAVTNLVKDLRQRVKAGGMTEDLLETVYGLGYRLNPEPEPEPESTPSPTLPQDPQKREQWLQGKAQLAARFQSSLQKRLTELDQAIRTLQAAPLNQDHRSQAKAQTHRLVGALGAFGYNQSATQAREMEHLLAQDGSLTSQTLTQLSHHLTTLQQTLTPTPPTSPTLLPTPHPSTLPPSHLSLHPPSHLSILILDSDPTILQELQAVQPAPSLELIAAPDWNALLEKTDITPPLFILLNLNLVRDAEGLERWQILRQQYPEAQVLVLAEQDNLADRVLASQVGCDRYMVKSVELPELLQILTQCFASEPPLCNRVMAVDDDEMALEKLIHLLEPWGLQVTPVSDPEQFWNSLTRINPDLLLLDIEMPGLSGIDLCRVVRQDCQYGDLPILVITAHTDPQIMQQVFAAGADDLIHKPILGPELVTRALGRLERVRLRHQLDQVQRQQTQHWQQQASIDALTQVANRYTFGTFMQQAWRQAEQNQQYLAVIFCDIDRFKFYNDRYGHQVGDQCLQHIAQLLAGCIRPQEDQVARYGGEEFVITMPSTDLTGALKVAERIHQAMTHLHLSHDGSTHGYVTLSMGITGTLPDPQKSFSTLLDIADQELYAAKANGGNTYCLRPYH